MRPTYLKVGQLWLHLLPQMVQSHIDSYNCSICLPWNLSSEAPVSDNWVVSSAPVWKRRSGQIQRLLEPFETPARLKGVLKVPRSHGASGEQCDFNSQCIIVCLHYLLSARLWVRGRPLLWVAVITQRWRRWRIPPSAGGLLNLLAAADALSSSPPLSLFAFFFPNFMIGCVAGRSRSVGHVE